MPSWKSAVTVDPAISSSRRLTLVNPMSSAESSYVPRSSAGTLKAPWSFVTVLRVAPVSTFLRLIVTPGRTASA